MKKLLSTFVFAFMVHSLYAQDVAAPLSKNTIFVEVGGNSPILSINYDRLLVKKDTWGVAGRVGAMFLPDTKEIVDTRSNHFYSVPVEVSLLVSNGNHHLETGIGLTPYYKKYLEPYPNGETVEPYQEDRLTVATFGRIGYRYQRNQGGLFFKAGFTPMTMFKKDASSLDLKFVYLRAGLALGYTFKS